MMNELFKDMIDEGWLLIYMDDMLIHSPDAKIHHERTLRVLEQLQKHDLFLKPEKCQFNVTKVEFLGSIIRPNEVSMDPVKTNGIEGWPIPKTVKETRSFLGFTGFYRRFIAGYAGIVRPLNDLTKKDKPWH